MLTQLLGVGATNSPPEKKFAKSEFDRLRHYGSAGAGLVIKAENNWCDGRPQVAIHRQLPPLLVLILITLMLVVCLLSGEMVK